MILEGAGVCPLIKIGDIVKGREVVDIRCDRHTVTSCSAFWTLAIPLVGRSGEQRFIPPWGIVNCDSCPVLANDPKHLSKTKPYRELIEAAIRRGDRLTSEHPHIEPVPAEYEEPKGIESVPSKLGRHDRFELIDISEEEQSDEESSSNPNQQ